MEPESPSAASRTAKIFVSIKDAMLWVRGFAYRMVCSLFKPLNLTAIATLILALATAYLAFMGHGQLGVLEADQRAWLFPEMKIGDDLVIRGRDGEIPIIFTLNNTGKSPALRAWAFAHLYPVVGDPLFHQDQKPRFCSGIGNLGETGQYVFPNQRGVITQMVVSTDGVGSPRTPLPIQGSVHLVIAGCLKYEVPADTRPHFTGIWFALGRADPATQWSFEFDSAAQRYPWRDISIHDMGVGHYAD